MIPNYHSWQYTKALVEANGIRGRKGEGGSTTAIVNSKVSYSEAKARLLQHGWELQSETTEGSLTRAVLVATRTLELLGDESGSSFLSW